MVSVVRDGEWLRGESSRRREIRREGERVREGVRHTRGEDDNQFKEGTCHLMEG